MAQINVEEIMEQIRKQVSQTGSGTTSSVGKDDIGDVNTCLAGHKRVGMWLISPLNQGKTAIQRLLRYLRNRLILRLRPYANAFLFKQAEFNSAVLRLLSELCEKFSSIEHRLAEISRQQDETRALITERFAI